MTALPTVRTVAALRAALAPWRAAGERIALVPTMGALHDGHASLVALARTKAARVVASLFVNPAQFAPHEDFAAYPRDEAADARRLREAGCDLLYAPSVEAMYPPGFATTVNVGGPAQGLEGAARPTHFAGVATVVAKLLIQAAPDVAVFGEKDYQQLLVIRRVARDLDLCAEIVGAPIVRAADGLALSSRNAYLSDAERAAAPALHRALQAAAAALRGGADAAAVEAEGRAALAAAGFDPIDYFAARTAEDLAALGPGPVGESARVLAAARLGRTRLIDNVAV
jgi:pantoate--beta-alanine ligase